MHLCFVGWGGHVHLERWGGYFARQGHRVSILSLSGRGVYPAGARQFDLGRFSFSYRLQKLYARWLLHWLKPDLVHVHYLGNGLVLSGAWSGPLVMTAWGSDIYRIGHVDPGTASDVLNMVRRADLITADSTDLARETEKLAGLPLGKVEVVQWGVDTETFTPAAGPSALARSLGIVGRPTVLSPRNFTPLYNLVTVVRAFKRVLGELPDAVLIMKRYAGTAEYVAEVEGEIDRLGIRDSVHVVERVPHEQMPDFYRTGQVIVSVPASDATPVSLLEGMACGCVPVASDLPSLREWIEGGVNGFLVPPGNVDATAASIVRALRDRVWAENCVAANVNLMAEHASQNAAMEQMKELYSRLVRS